MSSDQELTVIMCSVMIMVSQTCHKQVMVRLQQKHNIWNV